MHRIWSPILLIMTAFVNEVTAFAADTVHVPPEVRRFVEVGTLPISVSRADLNGDGLSDFVLVLERQEAEKSIPDADSKEGERVLLILVRQADGNLRQAKRNTKIVYCSTCGGMMGDPFVSVEAGPKTFIVSHYGGSAWRWSVNYRFNYSRRDHSWQLVRVEESSFHISAPERLTSKTYTPPGNFGKIDIADFDPDNWEGCGPR